MNYSQSSIANLALGRIGARGQITDLNENTPNAVKVLAVWDAIFQEVLSERDWKFAKTRSELQLSTLKPVYAYCNAWAMPADFLRFVRPQKRAHDNNWLWAFDGTGGFGWFHRDDLPFWPYYVEYKVEAILTNPGVLDNPAYSQFAITNYGGCRGPVKINYIRLITDYTQLLPGFVNCLANRLAAEIAITITEDKQKFQGMMEMYRDSLNSAEAQNETMDYQKDEQGSESWVNAGRRIRWGF